MKNKSKEKIKGLAICKCGHDSGQHCRGVSLNIYHCQVYGCKCEKFEWSGKRTKYHLKKSARNSREASA